MTDAEKNEASLFLAEDEKLCLESVKVITEEEGDISRKTVSLEKLTKTVISSYM